MDTKTKSKLFSLGVLMCLGGAPILALAFLLGSGGIGVVGMGMFFGGALMVYLGR